jgi:hypothetical protein
MKNAHLRFGKITFSRSVGKSYTSFSLSMDRFIGERLPKQQAQGHLLSVIGGDAQVAAAHAIVSEEQCFTVEGPELPSIQVTMGKDAQCYRASIPLSNSNRPLRHLIAVSHEFASAIASSGRTLLADDSPDYVWVSVAQTFGLPGIPEWAPWFHQRLEHHLAITQILGLGCRPVLVTGTKEEFLNWISEGIRKREIEFPQKNGPAQWPTIPLERLLLPSESHAELPRAQ